MNEIGIIQLNFLPINKQDFKFKVWIREPLHAERQWDDNIKQYKLPEKNNYKNYWISFKEFDNSKEKEVSSNDNINLTQYYLFILLLKKLQNTDLKYEQKENEKFFSKFHLYIITEETKYGKKAIRLEPYFLKSIRKFGFLIDYKFLLNPNETFSKEVQKLSFSLDNDYKSNINYHIDKYRYINTFLNGDFKNFNELSEDIKISILFEKLQFYSLKPKVYLFKNNIENTSQFIGLTKEGPFFLKEKIEEIRYIYLYHKEYKYYVKELIDSLNGYKFRTFMGLQSIGLPLQEINKNTFGIEIESFDNPQYILSKFNINENNIVIAIFPAKEEKFYYSLKNYCLLNNIPLQDVHLETIMDDKKLKWSISGIALQILTKLGNIPWVVKEECSNCLIVGIGQSIEKNDQIGIKRFLTYSVLLESTGKFLSIEPLAYSDNKEEYYKMITEKVAEIIKKYSSYKKIVFHIPEKIKKETINIIEKTLQSNTEDIELYIIRINDNSKFFGYAIYNNSLIPFESTYLRLNNKEFLLWTEGLNYNNTTPKKRYANPIYLEFCYSNINIKDIKHCEKLLQDIVNLSGVNYRGFNAKSLPVSIFYPRLISKFYKNFNNYNLTLQYERKDKMWFL